MSSSFVTHKRIVFTTLVVRLFLLIAVFVLIGCLMVAAGILLIISTLVGLILALLAGLLCGGLLLAARLCVSLTLSSLSAAGASGTLSRAKAFCATWYRKARPWFCLWIKRQLRCFVLFLMWQLWHWAAPEASTASSPGRKHWEHALPI